MAKVKVQDKPLTAGQQRTLDYVRTYIAKHGYSPTQHEIREGLGYSGVRTIAKYLQLLKRKRRLTWLPGQPRTIRVIETGWIDGNIRESA